VSLLRKGFYEYQVLTWNEAESSKSCLGFSDREAASRFLHGFASSHYNMWTIREVLNRTLSQINLAMMSRENVLELFASQVAAGNIKILKTFKQPVEFPVVTRQKPPPKEVAKPAPKPVAAPPPVPVEPLVNPLSKVAAAHAQMLVQAAQTGAPLCET